MKISRKTWNNYITLLRNINDKAAEELERWIEIYGTNNGITDLSQIRDDDGNSLIDAAYATAAKYGNAAAAVSAQMYDSLAELSGVNIEPAEMAANPEYGEVAKTVQGVLKTSQNVREVSGAVSRLVKRTGADTTLRNAARDGAQFAWIPSGDTCPFCLMLASNGWQYMSKKALRNGHAEHIHSNCDCTYAIRFDRNTQVAGYDPDVYREMYYNADGNTSNERLNSMRRAQYAQNKDVINAQKRMAYEERNRAIDYGAAKTFGDGKALVVARPVTRYASNNLYVDENVKISKAQAKLLDERITSAKNILGVADSCDVPVIVINDPDGLASYNPRTNILYVSSRMKSKKEIIKLQEGYAASKNVDSTMVHELIHWQDAEDYRAVFGKIQFANRNSLYTKYQNAKAEEELTKAGINTNSKADMLNISKYALIRALAFDYEEVYTEYRTKVLLEGGINK